MGHYRWALSAALAALALQVHAQVPDQPLHSSQPQPTYGSPDQPVQSRPTQGWGTPDTPVQGSPDTPAQGVPDQPVNQPAPTYGTPDQPTQGGQPDDGWDDGYDDDYDCACIGLDYTNGGSYLLDGNSDDLFVFNSAFEGLHSHVSRPVDTIAKLSLKVVMPTPSLRLSFPRLGKSTPARPSTVSLMTPLRHLNGNRNSLPHGFTVLSC